MKSLLVLVLLAASITAQAQGGHHVSLYATFTLSHASNVDAGNGTASASTPASEQYTNLTIPTEGGGATFHLANAGPLTFGLDLRGSNSGGILQQFNGEPSGYQTVGYLLLGVQVAMRNLKRFRPYAQLSSGGFITYVSDDAFAGGSSYDRHYFGFEGFAGLDYHLIRFLDLRLAEIGIGNAFNTSIADGSELKHIHIINFSTGIVAHF